LISNQHKSQFYAPPGKAIAVSLSYALATVVLALMMGLPAAWALSQDSHSLANRLLDPLLMLPLGTSSVTLGLGFILALAHPPLDLRTSPLLVPLAHTLVALPFVVRSLIPALRSIKPRLRQAASMLGASPWQVVRTIDLPLAGRAILLIYRFISQPGGMNYGQAMALSTLLMIVCAAGMLVIERLRIADIGEF
jgi:thiamine transport system permease protein